MCALLNTTWFWECNTHDVHGEGVGIDRVWAWTGHGCYKAPVQLLDGSEFGVWDLGFGDHMETSPR